MSKLHPCQSCGACCVVYKVSFDWSETSENSYQVPIELTTKSNPQTGVMKFVNPKKTRCVALDGNIGKYVSCSIYSNRPSPCRKFMANLEAGIPNPRCDEARRVVGLSPLQESDWVEFNRESEKKLDGEL